MFRDIWPSNKETLNWTQWCHKFSHPRKWFPQSEMMCMPRRNEPQKGGNPEFSAAYEIMTFGSPCNGSETALTKRTDNSVTEPITQHDLHGLLHWPDGRKRKPCRGLHRRFLVLSMVHFPNRAPQAQGGSSGGSWSSSSSFRILRLRR